jgi:hypothetical protein
MPGTRCIKQRILRTSGGVYPSVKLSLLGVRPSVAVHTLVTGAFLGPCPEGHEVAHIDNDPANNAASNLRWATALDAAADRARRGKQLRGESIRGAKLTEEEVRRIREMAAEGTKRAKLIEMFGVSRSQIWNIVTRQSWGWLDAERQDKRAIKPTDQETP